MGLSGSRYRRASDEAASPKHKKDVLKEKKDRDFNKSISMPALGSERRRNAAGSAPEKVADKEKKLTKNPSLVRRSDSTSKNRLGVFSTLNRNATGKPDNESYSNYFFSLSTPRQKSIRRDISHPISAQGREIIVQCFDNPHSEFGNKVFFK